MEDKKLLKNVLKYIHINKKVTDAAYNSFFKSLTIKSIESNPDIIYLQAQNQVVASLLTNRYQSVLEEAFLSETNIKYRIIIKTEQDLKNIKNDSLLTKPKKSSKTNIIDNIYRDEKIFNPNYTFENFVVGDSNKYAHGVCLNVAKSPSTRYNPLFIYGKSGLGKTHLMNAIGIYILENSDNLKILYVSSETFTNDYIKALTEKKIRDFYAKYRTADVLLIDDIQFLENKTGMQLEFFHTFNALHESNKQIIISSDRPPNSLKELDERLRSRFYWNMIASLSPPDYETRVAILQKKAENLNIEITDNVYEIICLISEKIKDNIRELEGAFNRIITFSQIMNEEINLSFAKRILKDIIQNGGNSITPEKIKNVVSSHYNIKVSDLESNSRKANFAYPRQIAMYLCRDMSDYSLPKIGNIFGNRHYSTVKHACDKIEFDIKNNNDLKNLINELKEKITG